MFIGHFAPAFVAAALTASRARSGHETGVGLGTFFIAAQLLDWAFFIFAAIGIEKMRIDPTATVMIPYDLYYYPFTHSLLGTGAWALAFGLLVAVLFRDALGGFLASLVVASHWLLDWVVHAPDLTLAGSGKTFGLGLWNFPEIAMPLEIGITLAAFIYYLRRSRGPAAQPLILIGVMISLQIVNWFAPHPSEAGLLLYGQALAAFAILTGFAVWTGENRYFMQRGGLAAGGR
ncbi:MAG: hypothetical protein AAF697_00295 [Pseudomonadota bacterium]